MRAGPATGGQALRPHVTASPGRLTVMCSPPVHPSCCSSGLAGQPCDGAQEQQPPAMVPWGAFGGLSVVSPNPGVSVYASSSSSGGGKADAETDCGQTEDGSCPGASPTCGPSTQPSGTGDPGRTRGAPARTSQDCQHLGTWGKSYDDPSAAAPHLSLPHSARGRWPPRPHTQRPL